MEALSIMLKYMKGDNNLYQNHEKNDKKSHGMESHKRRLATSFEVLEDLGEKLFGVTEAWVKMLIEKMLYIYCLSTFTPYKFEIKLCVSSTDVKQRIIPKVSENIFFVALNTKRLGTFDRKTDQSLENIDIIPSGNNQPNEFSNHRNDLKCYLDGQEKLQSINGICLTPDNIKKTREKWHHLLQSHKLDTSKHENYHLRQFTHNCFTNMPCYDHTSQNTVIKTSTEFKRFLNDIQHQFQSQCSGSMDDATLGTRLLFNFLKETNRTYAGLRLNKSGTSVKIIHYGIDEYPELRTTEEKLIEPAISGSFLNFSTKEKVEFFRLASFLKTLEKIGIHSHTSAEDVERKLQNYTNTGTHFQYGGEMMKMKTILEEKENKLLHDEKILVTYKGISLAFDTKIELKIDEEAAFLTEKYNINNFDEHENKKSSTKENRKEVQLFFERILQSKGQILMTGYAIAGFGDLVNFQMLYKTIIRKHPELKQRINAYAHFYRYSIANTTLNKLLDKDIKVVTHNNANRQWDPNYSYELVSEIAKTHHPEFEIQYNVGSVYKTVAEERNVLRVGEIGGMAGVSLVDDAYFTGLSRGGIGFGIPTASVDVNQSEIKEIISGILYNVLGQKPSCNTSFAEIIKERFALMMARENSHVINQRKFYDSCDVKDGQNLSVGKRLLAKILKAMTEQSDVDNPIILATSNIEALSKQASEVGVKLTSKHAFILNGSEYKQFLIRTKSGREAFVVQGFFKNILVNAIMKHASIPVVYSGEGSMNEGLSFGGKGFMIPFYDFQVSTLIESGGIASKQSFDPFLMFIDGNDDGFQNDPDKVVRLKLCINKLYINCEQYDLLKLRVGEQYPQMYLVTVKTDREVHIKKLDKTDVDFQVENSSMHDLNGKKTFLSTQATLYKLDDWAKEWMKLIYDRNAIDLDLSKLGQQTLAMLQEEKAQLSNWFDLLDVERK
ncbi:uncharacterized protein LOC124437299 [Xenia sp. Carnegie-2017]|uniref:uncharacterized protein LOC124437299 n=1 Tax=Xenia sp. Carnegie-2017 TaxID=2897299 RepID=UPI001F050100|nr:uncharacterized protein LOC124437299 [Xenia sp. Carnegie-2017]